MWWHRFINRCDAYAKQVIINSTAQYRTLYEPVLPELFEQHLAGTITLGLPALDHRGFSRWGCFDSDKDDGSLDKIEALLIKHGWHCVREGMRPGRQGHLWLFIDEPVPAASLRLIMRRFAEAAGVTLNTIEIFPKSDMPTYDDEHERYRASSLVKLPLGVNRKPDANTVRGLFRDAPPYQEEQLNYIQQAPFNNARAVIKMAQEIEPYQKAKTITTRSAVSDWATQVNRKEVEDLLAQIDPDYGYAFSREAGYKHWLRVGMILHNIGMPLELWESWSLKSAYVFGDDHFCCSYKWNGFKTKANNNRRLLGMGTLHYLAKQQKVSLAI